ncbi:DNA-binding response regulator, partial [Shewanella sp. SR44-4]|nr:DNA-binding response regulator [Shewanella sp. SR44-4]
MTKTTDNILLIDDDERLAAMIKEYLEKEGYSVTSAIDGSSGL